MKHLCFTLALMFGVASLVYAVDATDRIEEARKVFDEIMSTPDKDIPHDLLAKAHCLVIVPSVKRAGFIVGGQYGVGVAICRQPAAPGWTGPSTVRVEGGSLGLQIGGGETDVVMMVMNETGANKLMKSEFTLGGEGAVMAGPVGRSASAETDAYMRAEIISYSRSRGLFAGVALKGSTLRSDDGDNKKIYGRDVAHEAILQGRIPVPEIAKPLIATVSKYSTVEKK